jgi:hypothetical protein
MNDEIRHLSAILAMADREVSQDAGPDSGRCGVYFALLSNALPYLRKMLAERHEAAGTEAST